MAPAGLALIDKPQGSPLMMLLPNFEESWEQEKLDMRELWIQWLQVCWLWELVLEQN